MTRRSTAVARPRLVALDIDGTLLKCGRRRRDDDEVITPAGVRRRAPRASTPAPTSCWPAAARRYGMTRSPTCSACPRDGADVLVGGVQRRGDLPLPADRGASHEVTFDAAPRSPRARAPSRTRWSRSRSVGVGYRVNRHFPDGEITGEMMIADVDEIVAEPVTRVIIRDPRRHGGGLHRARREGSACTAPTTSSAGPRGSTSPPRASPRPPALEQCRASSASTAARRARDRRRPQRHRDAALGRSRRGHGPGAAEVQEAADAVTETVRQRRRRRRALALVLSRVPDPRSGWSPPTSTAPCCTPTALSPTAPARCSTALEELGVTVVFVTGRPMRWMDDLWEHVGGHGLAICTNGGIVYDVARARGAQLPADPRRAGLQVAGLMRAAIPGTTSPSRRPAASAGSRGSCERHDRPPELAGRPARGDLRRPTRQAAGPARGAGPRGVLGARSRRLVGHLVTTTWSSSGALVEISAAGVTKATHAGRALRRARASRATRSSPSGTCPTTWRCWSGPARRTRWPTRTPRAGRSPTSTRPANDDDGVAAVLEELFGL